MSTPLASPVYALGTWMGNVTDDYGVDWVVSTEDGWSSSPPVRAVVQPRANADGAWGGPGFYDARVINLGGVAVAPDRVAMLAAKDRLKAAIGPRSAVQLRVQEEHLTRVSMVRLSDQIDLEDRGAYVFTWSLTVVATDPRRYSEDVITATASLPTGLTLGRTYPRTYPVVFGGVVEGGGGSVFVAQDGDYDATPATITFTGPVISPRVEHSQTGRNLTFDLTLSADESLVVDLGRQTALLNGSSNRVYTISAGSAWFQLVPGLNELAFRGQVGPGPEGVVPQMTVTASSAWT